MLSTKLKEAAGNGADATLYVDDVFSTYLYTGNGSTQTITNGIDLAGKGGMVWLKSRSAAAYNCLFDTARGVNNVLWSNTTNAQVTYPSPFALTAFNSNGFNLNAEPDVNQNTTTYASWTFRKAAKFFDVVTYTGNGVAGRQIAHNLGVAPGMIIVKRTSGAANWVVYHRSTGNTKYLILNATFPADNDVDYWYNTTPTSTDFTVNSYSDVNASGSTYVAYLFAHDTSSTGIIQCGTYNGTGAAGNAINLGWEPQYVMIKASNDTWGWNIYDNMRGVPTGNYDNFLLAESAGAEQSSGAFNDIDFTATGFTLQRNTSRLNSVGGTFIYMAIRMPNKPPTSGTQVYNAVSYTGNGTANRAITSNFVVDLAIGMQRTPANGSDRFFVDRLRGATKGLVSWDTFAEATDANSLTSFASMTGVVVGTDTTDRGFNGNGRSLNPYFFKRAPAFFDVVCYTGTGSATTQAHNLTVVPELMIVKTRSNVGEWCVYSSNLGNTKSLFLSSTQGADIANAYWNSTTPTSSVFSIGTFNATNSYTYVAYLFATLAGISKVGSYTGNGTGQVIACGFSAGARFVLIKRTDAAGAWYTFDSARGLTSGSSPYLLLNSSAAEVTGNNGVYASTGGFTLGATAITTTNIATATYIFLAVA